MKNLLKCGAVALAMCLVSTTGRADDPKQTVYPAALFAFEERGVGVKDFGQKVTDLLFARLAADPEIFLVDRADIKKTLDEQAINISGAVNPDQATKVGQLTGAKLLLTGSILQVDKQIFLVAKIIGTETSRVMGASVEGKSSDELAPLVTKLAESISATIKREAGQLVAKQIPAEDRIANLVKSFKGVDKKSLPTLWIGVPEWHLGHPVIDPAVQTELGRICKALEFEIVDNELATPGRAGVIVAGQGFSEFAGRVGMLTAVKARVELKIIDRESGKILAVDRQTTMVVDLSEQIAGKSALQEAGAILAERMLPKILKGTKKN